jgi:hypothetical protein
MLVVSCFNKAWQSFCDVEGGMGQKELQKFKEAAAKVAREHDTPEKAREILTKIGYLNSKGEVSEKYR